MGPLLPAAAPLACQGPPTLVVVLPGVVVQRREEVRRDLVEGLGVDGDLRRADQEAARRVVVPQLFVTTVPYLEGEGDGVVGVLPVVRSP